MTRALRLRLLTAISVALAVLTVSGAFAARAPASSDGVVSFDRPAGDGPSAVARYWTAKRIAAARPLDARVNARGRLRVERSSAPRNHPIPFTSGPVTDAFLSGATVHGKLFSRLKGLDHECSATSVNSLNRSVILSAGHCVYDRRKGFARKLAFVPAYNNHLRPLGTWPYDSVYIPREWYQRNDHDFDFAAVVTDPQDGRGVNDAVGAVPLVANYPREQQTYAAFGYPINLADAQQMWRCDSPYGGDDPNAGPRTQQPPIAIGCDMGDGASGGGWIVSGAGIGSLTSFSYDGHPDVLYGPYFGERALAVFGKAESVVPGAAEALERRFAACVQESRGCSHRFVAGDAPVLRFKDREQANTSYRACVDSPGAGRACASGRTGARGESDYLSYLPGEIGRHVAEWSVDGQVVERWRFKVRPENA